MVGLADIPCLGTFVDRISNKTVDAVFRGFRYVFRYKALVDQLNAETAKLKIEKDNMSEKIREEEAHGKVIKDHVLEWQNHVQEIQNSGEELSPSCSCIQNLPIPNPVSRFRIGRNAAKKAKTVIELTATGKDYRTGGIANLPPIKNMPKSDTAFEEFQSRKDVYGKLWKGLVNKDSPLVHGIYGMAGVGKTRMMEQLWEDAMKKQIFNKVVRVNVGSENLDEYKLQDQIAARLDCELKSQDVESRASQLENSLRNGGKILLILDDVWEEIPLGHIIGTSFKDDSVSNGSKILLTSREKEACLLNHCEHPVEVKALSPDEALDLFMKTVGPHTINSPPDQSLVKKVCDECGQLPLLILAVGKALKSKRPNSWVDALNQLQNGKFENIPGVDRRVYPGIRLSIDSLEQDDAKSCLFLCCLFPEDAEIDMKMLIQLATGSQLIPDGESRVLAMVDSLKDSCLLLDSGKNHETKVHDIIRDVARNLASTDSKYAFLQERCKSQYLPSKQNYRTRKLLRLDAETDDVHFDEDVECPDLHTLWLQCNYHTQQFSDGFFQMFANLGCLMLQNVHISLEKFSLERLGNLRTLILLNCDISNTDVSLFPKKLETLCICRCKLPSPLDVANLGNLQKLEIQAGKFRMKSNVISSLSRLEELHVPNGFMIDLVEYDFNAIVMEISELTRLKSLQFRFDDDHTFQGRNVFPDIDRYKVSVGPKLFPWGRDGIAPSTKSIELYGNPSQSWEGLMVRAEVVLLSGSDVEVSSICNRHKGAFKHLEALYINQCGKMGHLARFSPTLQHGATCFSKLTILNIINCSELKYLFCNKIAKSLAQLQELMASYCKSMEAIIMNEGMTDGEILIFPRLKLLKMDNVPRLASFYAKKKNVHPGSTVPMDNFAQHHPFFDGMVAFPFLEEMCIKKCDNMRELASTSQDEIQYSLQHGATCFSKLAILRIENCSELKYLFCNKIAKSLAQLQELMVSHCESMEAIIMNEGTSVGEIIKFTKLKSLEIDNVPRLASFYAEKKIMDPGSTLLVDNFAEHRPFFDGMAAFPCLEKLVISGLPNTSVIWGKDCFNNDNVSSFCKLTDVELRGCDKLEIVIPQAMLHRLNNLEYVNVSGCMRLRTMFPSSVASDLTHLKILMVHYCMEMREIIEAGESAVTDNGLLFPEMTYLYLGDLQSLTSFWCYQSGKANNCTVPLTLPQLSLIHLERLPQLKRLFHGANFEFHAPALKQEQVKVYGCPLLEHIFEDVRVDHTS